MDPNSTQTRRPRTSEDFSRFCQIVLEYTKYDERPRQEELRQTASSPMDSAGSINSESTSSSKQDEMTSSSDDDNDRDSDSVDSDSYNLVTCYCGKPFAGRPMIECSICLTWVHLTCAKVKRNNIPEVFSCNKCKNKQTSVMTDSNTQNHRARKKVSL